MKKTIKELQEKRKKLREELYKIDKAIESLRDVCDHKLPNGESAFELVGHDSHKDHYVCSICGETDYV